MRLRDLFLLELNRKGRFFADKLIAYLESRGIRDAHIIESGKHPRLVFSHMGRPLSYFFSGTSGDSKRAIMNCIADLKRMLSQVETNPGAILLRRQP